MITLTRMTPREPAEVGDQPYPARRRPRVGALARADRDLMCLGLSCLAGRPLSGPVMNPQGRERSPPGPVGASGWFGQAMSREGGVRSRA